MSYDLHVYSGKGLAPDDLRELVEAAGFGVDQPGGSESLTVTRGVKGKYSFSLGPAQTVEPEDVPDEVTAVLLDASFFYEILVEGSSSLETPHAVKFARNLAVATHGAVLDQQTGQVWTRGKLRTAPRVERGTVSTVEVRWYVRGGFDAGRTALTWTRLSHRHLPEALPRRYGTFEPLQHKFDGGGDQAFADFAHTADDTVYFKATQPALEGHLAAGPRGDNLVVSHSLTLMSATLVDPGWRTSLRGLFIDFATENESVLATAEVVRGALWSGRSLGYTALSERPTHLAQRGRWAGPPPYPVWWTWFGPEYAALVAAHLPASQVAQTARGLFHWRSETPADRDALTKPLTPPTAGSSMRRLLRRDVATEPPRPWLPAELLPVVDRSDPRLYNPPVTPAFVRPDSLI